MPRSSTTQQAKFPLALAALLSATAFTFSAAAQEGDVAAGRAFAREACKLCHIVEPDDRATRTIVIGPGFRDIANTPSMMATVFRVFLRTSHPKMHLILTAEQTADVIAYILSLRDPR
jgi:cytochrome c2